jgi:predicted GNAT superfamily acetyltransferase
MWRIIDNVAGSDAAAPIPMMIRPITSSLGLTEIAQTIDPLQKIATPISIKRLRPKLSPRAPNISMRLANARA